MFEFRIINNNIKYKESIVEGGLDRSNPKTLIYEKIILFFRKFKFKNYIGLGVLTRILLKYRTSTFRKFNILFINTISICCEIQIK